MSAAKQAPRMPGPMVAVDRFTIWGKQVQNDPTVYHVGDGDSRYVFVPGIVKPLAVGNAKRAAFIVTACNAHDDLVAALTAIAEMRIDMPETTTAWAKNTARAALAKVQP